MTPHDVKVAGTFAEKPAIAEAEPRKPTQEEMKANNNAMLELTRNIGDPTIWKPIFKEDLKRMNEARSGARSCTPTP